MAKRDYYFGKKTIDGIGRFYFLRAPYRIGDGSNAENLLGSLVREGDIFLGDKYPIPEHSHVPRSVLKAMVALGDYSEAEMTQSTTIATGVISVDINKSIGTNGKAQVPGAPVDVGLEINYKKVKSIDVDLGGLAEKRYLSEAVVEECYRKMAQNRAAYPLSFFDNDRMLVDKILIVPKLAISITSKTTFDAGLTAKLNAAGTSSAGISFSSVTDRSFTINIDDGHRYLLGIGAIQADRLAS